MAKLGYTWYPKDWGNSEKVFELNLSERGFYRELIDLAMLNNNETEVKKTVWSRKFNVSVTEIETILKKLSDIKLIKIKEDSLFIPSCETRLNLSRGGSKGGKNSKPTTKPKGKPIPKPFESLEAENGKPTPNQIEIETKRKEKEKKFEGWFEDLRNGSDKETIAMHSKINIEVVKLKIEEFKMCTDDDYPEYGKFVTHFKRWLNLNPTIKQTRGMVY